MRKVAIIQVRTTSHRLPNKCLLKLFGKTILEHVVNRLKYAKTIDDICIATTINKTDDVIEQLATKGNIPCYRGQEDDVLDRFFQAAKFMKADVICRITADDPLKDPIVLDDMMAVYLDGEYDYVSNTLNPTFPEGIDIEIFSFEALSRAWEEGRLPSEREHVTPYIWKNSDIFHIYSFENVVDLSFYRWTLDRAEDWVFIQQVYEYLYQDREMFYMNDVLVLLKKIPWLAEINSGIIRNEGYIKSIEEEKRKVDD